MLIVVPFSSWMICARRFGVLVHWIWMLWLWSVFLFANKYGGRTDEFLEDVLWFLVYLEVGKRIGKLHFPEEKSSSNHGCLGIFTCNVSFREGNFNGISLGSPKSLKLIWSLWFYNQKKIESISQVVFFMFFSLNDVENKNGPKKHSYIYIYTRRVIHTPLLLGRSMIFWSKFAVSHCSPLGEFYSPTTRSAKKNHPPNATVPLGNKGK